MEDVKSIFASRTFWGGLLAVVAGALGLMGYTLSPEDQTFIVEGLVGLASFVGGVVAIYGRVKASKRIGKPGDADWPQPTNRLGAPPLATLAALGLALLALTACANPPPIVVTAQEIVEEAETPREHAFAVLAVFERLAESATRYAEQPTTSAAEIEAILEAVARGEDAARLTRLAAAREDACLAEQEAMEAPPDRAALLCGRTAEYEGLAAALEAARAELQRHVGTGGA